MTDHLEENVRAHDKAARHYERDHVEIFNAIEQDRLRLRLKEALLAVRSTHTIPLALDLGAGTGNLTGHLLTLGARVIAADVSRRSLDVLRERFGDDRSETVLLGPGGLAPLRKWQFDLVAMYSVLHHIANYAGFLGEAASLCPVGGVVYIDHEACPSAWQPSAELQEWRRLAPTMRSKMHRIRQAATLKWFLYRVRRLRDPRATLEGDIHVWQDDHVEWSEVERVLTAAGYEIVSSRDHLQYRKFDDAEAYERFATRCADTRSLIARRVM